MRRYDSLKQTDKQKISISNLKSSLDDANNAIYQILDWGLPNLLSLFSNIMSFILVCFQEDLHYSALIIIVYYFIAYKFKIHNWQKEFKTKREKQNKLKKKLENVIALLFHDRRSNRYSNLDSKVSDKRKEEYKGISNWRNMQWKLNLVNMGSIFLIVGIIYSTPEMKVVSIITLLGVLKSVNTSFQYFTSFLNRYDKFILDITSFEELFKGKESQEMPEQLELPEKYTFQLNIKQKTQKSVFTLTSEVFSIFQGQRVLIKGASGAGKSTILKAFRGEIEGCDLLDKNKPRNGLTLRHGIGHGRHRLAVHVVAKEVFFASDLKTP